MKSENFAEAVLAYKNAYEEKHGNREALLVKTETMKKFFDPKWDGPRLPFRELMTLNDFGILFQRVITDQLVQPVEPQYLGVAYFSRTVPFTGNQAVRFPIMSAVVAHDVPLNNPIPREDLAFSQQMMTMDALRSGVAFDIQPELLDDSMYNLVGFLVEAGRRALVRHKEQKVWNAVLEGAHVMYDNSSSDSNAWTSGKGDDHKQKNGSFALDDFISMMAGLMVNGYSATDILTNPLAWSIWLRDPLLRAQFYTEGAIGASVFNRRPDLNGSGANALNPWGLNFLTTRFMPVRFDQTISGGVPGATGTANQTDILMVDRNNQVLILQREGLTSDRWDSKETEIITLAMKEKYAVYGLDQGKSAVIAKNVRLVENQQPIYTATQVVA